MLERSGACYWSPSTAWFRAVLEAWSPDPTTQQTNHTRLLSSIWNIQESAGNPQALCEHQFLVLRWGTTIFRRTAELAGNLKAMLYMEQLKKLELLVNRTLRTDKIPISKCLCNDYQKPFLPLVLEERTNTSKLKLQRWGGWLMLHMEEFHDILVKVLLHK